MPLKNPSFSSLTAFVTVGRHKSFRRASEELLLTPGAVSQKIKSFEDQLGAKLFHRTNRDVSFTAKGKTYYDAVAPLIQEISKVTHDTFGKSEKQSIVISVMPAFALRWLIPRLESFYVKFPELTVNINASAQLTDFAVDEVDLAIRHGLGNYPGLHSVKLFSEGLVPVCSPKLIGSDCGKLNFQDLKSFTLLHDAIGQDWNLYLKACGADSVDPFRGPKFDGDNLMIQAAIEGHGVTLARRSLVQDAIDVGKLIVPLDHKMPSDFAYYAVYPKKSANVTSVRIFKDWLVEQAEGYSDDE